MGRKKFNLIKKVENTDIKDFDAIKVKMAEKNEIIEKQLLKILRKQKAKERKIARKKEAEERLKLEQKKAEIREKKEERKEEKKYKINNKKRAEFLRRLNISEDKKMIMCAQREKAMEADEKRKFEYQKVALKMLREQQEENSL